jgi:hypothetical protein
MVFLTNWIDCSELVEIVRLKRSSNMGTAHYKYPVRLSEEQHGWLETMVHTSRTPAKHYLVARVLLMSDQREARTQPHRRADC